MPEKFKPRLLRSTFVTAMRDAGADFPTLQAYIGHRPDSVPSRHYDRIDMDRLAAIARLGDAMATLSGAFEDPGEDGIKNATHLH